MNKNIIITCIVVVIVVGAYIVFKQSFFKSVPVVSSPTPTPLSVEENKSLGEEISSQIQDPTDNIPKTNPYKDGYTNPFK